MRDTVIKREDELQEADALREEYDLFKKQRGVRDKCADHYRQGSNTVVLAPDVVEAFPNAVAADDALRMLIKAAKSAKRTS